MDRVFDEKFLDDNILTVKQQDTFASFAIASGPACFLIIAFHILWHLIVDDVTDIALIDAHAEGVSRHHDGNGIEGKSFLSFLSCTIAHASMIFADRDAILFQFLVEAVYLFSRRCIDNTGFTGVGRDVVYDVTSSVYVG